MGFLWPALGVLAITVLSGVSAPRAEAEESPHKPLADFSLEELTALQVTTLATGTRKPLAETPAIASVLTLQDFEAMGATNVEEALAAIPGLHVSFSGQSYAPRYLIRGITSTFDSQTLVLLNGIPITSIVRGERNVRLGILPLSMVSKIEVIRGPGSALYGADAFAGVINVVTRKADELQGTETGGAAGSFNSRRAWLRHGGTHEDLKIGWMIDYSTTDGQSRIIEQDAQSGLDQATGTQASLAPGPVSLSEKSLALFMDAEGPKWRLRGALYGKNDLGAGQGVTEVLDPSGRISRSRSTIDLTYHEPTLFNEHWDFTSQLAYQHVSQEIDESLILFPPGANLGSGVFTQGMIGNPEIWEREVRFDNSVLYSGFSNHRLRFGVGYFFGHIYRIQESKNFTASFGPRPDLTDVSDTSDTFLPENSRYSFYGVAQDEWRLAENWETTLGLRFDHFSDFGDTFNPRAALVWKTSRDLTTKLLYGHAFRAPTMADLHTANNPAVLGNQNLKPETIQTFELAWLYRPMENASLSLNLFHYQIRDLITFVRDPVGVTATAQNSANHTGNGLDLEIRLKPLRDLTLTGYYSYARATNDEDGMPAGDFPYHRAYARADASFLGNWNSSAQLSWTGERDRMPRDPRAPLKGYVTADAVLRHTLLGGSLELLASVKNIFDADAREPSTGPGATSSTVSIPNDLPQAGRSFFTQARYRF